MAVQQLVGHVDIRDIEQHEHRDDPVAALLFTDHFTARFRGKTMTNKTRAGRTARAFLLTGAVLGAGAALGAPAASAASSCDAAALHLSVLGALPVDGNRANPSGTPCVAETGLSDLTGLSVLTASLVEAQTTRTADDHADATSRVTGLHAGTGAVTPTLTTLLTSGPNSLLPQVTSALSPLIGQNGTVTNAVAPLSALGLDVVGLDLTTLANDLTASLPGALETALPSLLDVGLIEATATAVCTSGVATLGGTTTLTGVTVLGTPIDANDPVGKVVSIDSANLTLAQLLSTNDVLKSIRVRATGLSVLGLVVGTNEMSLYDLLTTPSGLLGTVNAALPFGTTVASILDGLSASLAPTLTGSGVPLPTGVLHAVVTPKISADNGSVRTETALSLNVTALSQPVLSGELARASVSADAAGCVVPTPTPTATPSPSPTPTPTATPSPSPTPTATPSPSPTATPSPTTQPTPTPTPPTAATPTPEPEVVATASSIDNIDPTPTPAATPEPQADPAAEATARWTASLAAAALKCEAAPLRLIDVRPSGDQTLVQGVAQAKFVGATASIFLTHGNKKVGTTKVLANGRFQALVARPDAAIAGTNSARYYATISGQRTAALKFARRMYTTSLTTAGGMVTFKGRVTQPRADRQAGVVIQQRIACGTFTAVAKAFPDARGRFSVTFKAPAGKPTSAIYRAQTAVPRSVSSKTRFETYTLPKVLMLG